MGSLSNSYDVVMIPACRSVYNTVVYCLIGDDVVIPLCQVLGLGRPKLGGEERTDVVDGEIVLERPELGLILSGISAEKLFTMTGRQSHL
jgi:hypothetical protein